MQGFTDWEDVIVTAVAITAVIILFLIALHVSENAEEAEIAYEISNFKFSSPLAQEIHSKCLMQAYSQPTRKRLEYAEFCYDLAKKFRNEKFLLE